MKAEELRIGNIVYDKNWDCSKQLGATDIYEMKVKGSDNFNEILLTPEWLERCGHKCDIGNGWEYQIQAGALNWYFRWNTEWYSEIGGIYIDSRVQYVHQLQNLYFALTGKELLIKEP